MARTVREIGLSVKRLQMRQHRAINGRLAPLGISIVQWDALRHLDEHPGASLHELALLTFQTDQSFGALATRLIERGLIERLPGPGRAIRHRLTPKGDELRRAGQCIVDDVLVEAFSPLSSVELASFDGLLDRLLADDPR